MLKHRISVAAVGVAASLLVAACGGTAATTAPGATTAPAATTAPGATTAPSTAAGAYKIGFILPETAVARYETKDKPFFEAKLKAICPSCVFLYANANSNASDQAKQADSMLAQGVNVLVVDPFDGVAAASIVNAGKAKNVPVVAYDRLIQSPDLAYIISNDYLQVGVLQGKALIDKLKADKVAPSACVLMMNGATTDNNAGNIKKGALSQIQGSGYDILASIDTWDPAEAQTWVSSQITKYPGKICAIYSANDGNAGGAIAALHAAGVKPIPPITGLDASQAGLQAILAGDMYMTVYNAFRTEAEKAAEVAYSLAQGQKPASTANVNGIPASLNPPQAVLLGTIQSTVIADGFFTAADICTAQYAAACTAAGIK
jgi:D-xylose transport system substrate-binding protein